MNLVVRGRKSGDLTAIQCKFYEPTHTLRKEDVDSLITPAPGGPRRRSWTYERSRVCADTKVSRAVEDVSSYDIAVSGSDRRSARVGCVTRAGWADKPAQCQSMRPLRRSSARTLSSRMLVLGTITICAHGSGGTHFQWPEPVLVAVQP